MKEFEDPIIQTGGENFSLSGQRIGQQTVSLLIPLLSSLANALWLESMSEMMFRSIPPHMGSPEAMKLIRDYLDLKPVRNSDEPRNLPDLATRLDLDSSQDGPIRLVCRGTEAYLDADVPYVALSYGWGQHTGQKFGLLQKERPENYRQKVPRELLKPTLQDAIAVTFGLGYRYFWVD